MKLTGEYHDVVIAADVPVYIGRLTAGRSRTQALRPRGCSRSLWHLDAWGESNSAADAHRDFRLAETVDIPIPPATAIALIGFDVLQLSDIKVKSTRAKLNTTPRPVACVLGVDQRPSAGG